ncbi:MAG: hypothetical protein FJ006_07580 [Chloroflexi bacterium]|nr:hypothetical protein [Chloroflexota bacterium]
MEEIGMCFHHPFCKFIIAHFMGNVGMVNSCPLWYPFSIGISSFVFIWLSYRVGYADSFFHHIRDTSQPYLDGIPIATRSGPFVQAEINCTLHRNVSPPSYRMATNGNSSQHSIIVFAGVVEYQPKYQARD